MTDHGDSGDRRRFARLGGWDVALSVLVAFNFAVAQPILDLTGRFPQFFLARRSPKIDLIFLAVGLAIAIPLVIGLIVWLVGLIAERTGVVVHVVVVGGLIAGFAIQLLERLPGLERSGTAILIGLAIVLGAAIVAGYYRSATARRLVRFAAISAVAIPLLFLFSSPTSRLVLRQSSAISGSSIIGNPVPVAVLILDELPVASLMNAEHDIDAAMFPSFARLAAGSTWFRNATAVHDFTEIAVPAILTGRYGDKRKLPVASQYPDSLFTLLGGAYRVNALESFTQLCPVSICRSSFAPVPAFPSRWRSMLSDLRVIYEHLIAPPDIEAGLPSIDQTWANFGAGTAGAPASAPDGKDAKAALSEDPLGDLRRFTASVEPSNGAALWLAHAEVPHAPWRYLPSGQEYSQKSPIPGRIEQVWGSDEWLVTQAYQRHLLQVAAADTALGAWMDRLKAKGIWDRALVVVTADHGVAFRNGSDLRVVAKGTAGEIGAVPMFVKLPGQRAGSVNDRPVQTFDVVPTIADVLDVQGAYEMEGISMLDETAAARTSRIMRSLHNQTVELGVTGDAVGAVVARKLRLFGSEGGIERVYAVTPGRYGELLGRSVGGGDPAAPGTVSIDSAGSYQRFDPRGDTIRALMTGTVAGLPPRSILAVAVRGRIVAVTRTYVRGGQTRFNAMLDPAVFQAGKNQVEVFLVGGSPGSYTLNAVPPVA